MAEASNDVGGEHEKREEPEVSMDTQEVELQDSDNMSAAVCTETKYDKVLNAMDRMELIAFAKKTLTENPSARIHLPKPFRLEHKRGDLFECEKTESLAHCVSEDMRMGKGIAVIFKKKFGGVKELKAQEKKTGEVAVLENDSRFIYYLVTKTKATDKPTYDSLKDSLNMMKQHCVSNKVRRLSMPRIGCGLDGLEWYKVSQMITDIFCDIIMKITIYTLPPQSK